MCAAIRRDASPPRAGEIRQVAVAILGIAGLRAAFDDDLDRLSLVFIQPAVDDPGGARSDSAPAPLAARPARGNQQQHDRDQPNSGGHPTLSSPQSPVPSPQSPVPTPQSLPVSERLH